VRSEVVKIGGGFLSVYTLVGEKMGAVPFFAIIEM
jgi:hypothetical protein